MPPAHDDLRDRPVGELLKQLSQETSTLVKQELELAKAEMAQKGKHAGLGAGFIGAGALFGLGAFGAITACLIALLATAVDHVWLAALIVALAYGAVAAVLAQQGTDKIQEAAPAAPEQTVESVKEDVEWAKTQTRSAGR
ncbi:MAG: phage holin family protein [Actinobacteria bacterium]|nr:phage holin family protein [Actinomycetota bacterium]